MGRIWCSIYPVLKRNPWPKSSFFSKASALVFTADAKWLRFFWAAIEAIDWSFAAVAGVEGMQFNFKQSPSFCRFILMKLKCEVAEDVDISKLVETACELKFKGSFHVVHSSTQFGRVNSQLLDLIFTQLPFDDVGQRRRLLIALKSWRHVNADEGWERRWRRRQGVRRRKGKAWVRSGWQRWGKTMALLWTRSDARADWVCSRRDAVAPPLSRSMLIGFFEYWWSVRLLLLLLHFIVGRVSLIFDRMWIVLSGFERQATITTDSGRTLYNYHNCFAFILMHSSSYCKQQVDKKHQPLNS